MVFIWWNKNFKKILKKTTRAFLSGAHFARGVIAVDCRLLQENVERLLVLGERVTGNFVDEDFEPFATVFDEARFKDAVVISEWEESADGFAREWGDYHLNLIFKNYLV